MPEKKKARKKVAKKVVRTIDKVAEKEARANREQLFKAESKRLAAKPGALRPTVEAMARALGYDKGKVPEEIASRFEALRVEMVNAAPPKLTEQ